VNARKDGKALQRLIRAIEGALAAGNETIKIETGKRFPDKSTGKPREHDVVLTLTNKHHETIIVLECRDRSRPVGVDAVEAFHTKCLDTGIHSGIIVSASRFCRTAVKKASRYNIRCLTLDEAEGFDWCGTAGMKTYERLLTHAEFYIIFPEGPDIDRDTIQTEDGAPLNPEMIKGWGRNALDQYHPTPWEEPGEHRARLRELNPPVYGIRGGERVRAKELRVGLIYTVTVGFAPFSFRTYVDVGRSKQVTQAAVCEVAVTKDNFAEIVLSTNEHGEINITLVGRDVQPNAHRSDQ
jgi:hypothetical protein